MEENTNKAIAVNSLFLYARLALNAICMLLTTRFALQALGVSDFGLFSVLGGVISFITLFNTIMLSASNRFIAVAIGKGDINGVRTQFNVNLIIHVGIAVLTLLVLLPIGNWYVLHYLNFDGDLEIARNILNITIIGSVLSFISVPYNGLLMAKEKFSVFCITDVVSHLFKLFAAILINYCFQNKLMVYAFGISICTALPLFVYYVYCNKYYREIVKFSIEKNRKLYKEVFDFSAWVSFGAFASIGRSQGASILVNVFFNTIMNTALGIAQSVNALVSTFSQSLTQPMTPQITKTYASGNMERCSKLLVMNTKIEYLAMLIISSPFFIASDWILSLWLGEVPPYASLFIVLLIIDNLVASFNSGISVLIFASGKIKLYQILVNINRIISVVVAYVVLKFGAPAYSLLYCYIGVSVVNSVVMHYVLHKTINIDRSLLIRKSYIPCLLTTIFVVPLFFIDVSIPPIVKIVCYMIVICIFCFVFGFSKNEKQYVINLVKSKIY